MTDRFEGSDDDLKLLPPVEFVPDPHAADRIAASRRFAEIRSELTQLLAELDATGLGPLMAPHVRHTTMGDGRGNRERGVRWEPAPGWVIQVPESRGSIGRAVYISFPEMRSHAPDVDAYDPSELRTIARALLAAAAWADSDLID